MTVVAAVPGETRGAVPGFLLVGYVMLAAGSLALANLWQSARGELLKTAENHFAVAAGTLNLAFLAISTIESARRTLRGGAGGERRGRSEWQILLRNALLAAVAINAMRVPASVWLVCFQLGLLVISSADCLWCLCKSIGGRRALGFQPWRVVAAATILAGGGAIWFVGMLVSVQLVVGVTAARFRAPAEESQLLLKGERRVAFQSPDGVQLKGIYLQGDEGAPGVVICHGIADRGDSYAATAMLLRGFGCHSLRFDFRAHGESGGAVCAAGVAEARDVEAAFELLRAQEGIDRERIYLLGHSMGAAAALNAAAPLEGRGLAGIMAIAPATDLRAITESRLRFSWLLSAPLTSLATEVARLLYGLDFDRDSALESFGPSTRVPVLLFFAPEDRFIPASLANDFQIRYPERVQCTPVAGATHNELVGEVFDLDSPYFDKIRAFLRNR